MSIAARRIDLAIAAAAVGLSLGAVALCLRTTAPAHPRGAADFMAALDSDADELVSRLEYERVSDGVLPFATLDADHSGALDLWELELILTSISPLLPQQNLLPRVR